MEDEIALRTAIARMLQGKGFSVIQAGDGTAALDRLRSHNGEIGAMLLDLTLPGASSRDVFEEAKRRCPNLHIILTSAYSQEIAEASFPEIGAARFIRKPFPIADLLSLIREPLPR